MIDDATFILLCPLLKIRYTCAHVGSLSCDQPSDCAVHDSHQRREWLVSSTHGYMHGGPLRMFQDAALELDDL